MRTYEILNEEGHRMGVQELSDEFAPALLAGQTAHLTHIDGVAVSKKAQVFVGPEADVPAPVEVVTVDDEKAERARRKAEREAQEATK